MTTRRTRPFSDADHPRVLALAARGFSAEKIASTLKNEGVAGASRATIQRRLSALRGPQRVRVSSPPPARAAHPKAPSAPSEAEPYVPDDDAIDAHVGALGDWLDRRVDAAVAAELADAESLADRWKNRADAAGWPSCPACGQPVRPEGVEP